MKTEMNMIYWKAGKFWLGKLKEHPEIMTQGRTLEELEENIRDAYVMTSRSYWATAIVNKRGGEGGPGGKMRGAAVKPGSVTGAVPQGRGLVFEPAGRVRDREPRAHSRAGRADARPKGAPAPPRAR